METLQVRHPLAVLCLGFAIGCAPAAASAQAAAPAPAASPGKVLIEIYRIAPGKHKDFLKLIDQYDEANRQAGLPPRQLYVHQDGAEWDFILIQPADTPEGKSEALAEAVKRVGAPRGADFFFEVRRFIASHSDTFALGPTTAKDWLAKATPER